MTPPDWAAEDPPTIHAWRFSPWKKPFVRRFFPQSDVRFVQREADVPAGATLAVWGADRPPVDATTAVWHLEDGFLRSVGLGADLVQPLSWVVDRRGLYFDAREPSDLEQLLATEAFTGLELQRAAALRQALVSHALTKYNVAGAAWRRPATVRSVVLVPGQVEADASIRLGSPTVRTNLDLLRLVREARPEAYLVYKPHPDVAAGLRRAGSRESQAHEYCDEVLGQANMAQLLTQVDELHTMTSLTGFEALLRGLRVTCWGQPFYAGWGLTDDRVPLPRRQRRLSLDELVAGSLLRYPRYVRRDGGAPGTAESALDDLRSWRERANGEPALWQRALRPIWGARAT